MVLAACWHSYSYSNPPNYIYQSSGNAAQDGLNWVMSNVIPQYTGLQVNGIVYQYTTIKDTEDEMYVTVQNEDAENPGQYIFREVDDWTGQPSNTIRKVNPMPYTLGSRFGDGSITVEGDGEVVDASVTYTYRYDENCANIPQTNPQCPDYVVPEIPVIEDGYDALQDDVIQDELDREQVAKADEDQEDRDREKSKDKEDKKREMIEVLLGTTNTTALAGQSQMLHEELLAMDFIPPAYLFVLPSTVYEETVTLQDSELPDNPDARRNNFAQQLLHDRLVDLQYQR